MKMQLIKKNDFEKLIAVCWITLFILWGYVAISGNYFEIVVANPTIIKMCDFIDKHVVLNYAIRLIMYYLNWIFVIHAILQKKLFKFKPILISLGIILLWIIKTIFIEYTFINLIDFVMFGILAIVSKKKWYRAIIGCIATLLFSSVSSLIKNYFITNVDSTTFPSLIMLIMYIDVYLMSYIYYLYSIKRKEGKVNETLSNYAKQHVDFLQIKQKVENHFCNLGNSISSWFKRVTCRNVIKDNAYKLYCGIIFALITYLSLLIVGIIFNRWIEMTVSAVFFHIFRGKDEETYHAKNDLKCWCVSMLSFIVIMKLTLPIYISYIVSIALAFGLCMIMRCIYFIRKMIAKGKHNSKRKKLIEIIGEDNINEDYIEDLCTKKGLNYKYSETVYLYLTNTLEETALILDTNNSTVTRRLNRFIELYS